MSHATNRVDGFRRFSRVDKEAWSSLPLRVARVPMPSVRPVRRGYGVAKRIMDLAICLAILPIALPLMAVSAALIWLEDRGPVLFRQMRTGKAGRRFAMLKFRTMVLNAEELKEKYAHLNQLTWPDFKIADDPRVTGIGKLLRKTSLDELPQLLNVIRGEMSLVGPRPTSFDVSTYKLWHAERLEVLPGITGLWQISGRSDVDFDERLRLDVEYITRRSLWLDVRILAATVTAVVHSEGAY
ncbi:MAG: hypothetical protein A2V98_01590 [Planctomycetes bacterium RBG_16_64_12]|nr:MAG: hypothetical protein A2V98_01590 [Planctomycetes bacterium RBG_16_64_12]